VRIYRSSFSSSPQVGDLAYFGFIRLFLGPILLGVAIAAFKIYRDNYQTRAGLLVTPEGARQVDLSSTRGEES
jgi:hypothetical protein